MSLGALWKIMAITLFLGFTARATVTLPVEVMGGQGTNATVTVTFPSGVTATSLWLKIHGTSYADKVSVKINGGTDTPLNNTTVTLAEPGKSYGGFGSNYPVLEMTIDGLPSGLVTAGTNTITFTLHKADPKGISSGFRVVDFDFLDASGRQLLASSNFTYDDPNAWTPPLNNASDIHQGGILFQTEGILSQSPLTAPTKINASCAGCHTLDGHDLKYFNYSNLSIQARAQFHGLTSTQGKQIASYIRSLNFPNPGRPWNPPYQPAVNIDTLPVSSWAAGGGLDAVLADDRTALNCVFPNGISPKGNAIGISQTLNVRTTPTEYMLLDWNHWLPRIHPKDAPTADGLGTTFVNSAANHFYNGEGTASTAIIMQSCASWISSGNWATINSALSNWENDTQSLGNPLIGKFTSSPPTGTATLADELYALKQWKEVKMWDVMSTFGLEGYGPQLVGSSSERSTWPRTGESFLTSPNRNFIPWNVNDFSNSQADYEYVNNAWYELQFILNAGNRLRAGNAPIDWPYIRGRVTDLQINSENNQLTSGWPEVARLVMMLAKGMQQNDGTAQLPPTNYTSNGWAPTNTGDLSILVSPSYANLWTQVTASQKRQVLNALLKIWLAKCKQYTVAQYYQDYNQVDGPVGPITQPDGTTTNAWSTEVHTANINGGFILDKVFCMIPLMRTAGVDNRLLNDLCDWAATIWPAAGNDWNSLKTTITYPDLPTTNLVGRWTFDEGFGSNVVDWSDAGIYTGVLQGTTLPTWITSGQKVGYGAVALTSAQANQVSVPNWPSLGLNGPLSISAWVKFNTVPTTSTPAVLIANTKTTPTASTGFQFSYDPRNFTIDFYGSSGSVAVASYRIADTNWHQMTVTFDGTNVLFYIDINVNPQPLTMAVGHTTAGSIVSSSNPLAMGSGLDGQMDDVRIYNRVLSASEISTLNKVNQ